jgi:hypothetical protein
MKTRSVTSIFWRPARLGTKVRAGGRVTLFVASFTIAFLSLGGFRTEAATVTWTNTASGGWNASTNWSPNGVPGSTDTAIITNAGVTVSLNESTTVGAIILGTNGAGTVTLSLVGQTLGLNGPLTVNPSGSFTVDSGTLVGNTNAVLNGTIGWTAGDLSGILTVASDGTLNITQAGANHDLPDCTLTNNGTVTWMSGTLRGGNTVIYNNGLWDAQSDENFNNALSGNNPVFYNFGTFRKSGGASELSSSTTFQSVIFNQLAGEIDVKNGTNGLELAFQGGGSFTGGFITTNSQGLTVFSVGNFNLNGTVTGTNTWEDAGNLVGNNVINGALNWVSGNWNGATSVTIATNSTLIVAGGGGNNDMDTIVTNNGTVAWVSGTLRGGSTTVYNNGLWDAQSDQVLNDALAGSPFVFNNFGTFRKSGGASELSSSTTFQSVIFNQLAGEIDVKNGTNGLELAFQGGGSFTGGFITTNSQGLTVFSVGNFNLNGTVTGTNTWEDAGNLVGNDVINGALNWVSGNWNGATSVTIATNSTLIVAGGGGNNDMDTIVTNNGTVAWVSGTLRGGSTTVYNNGLWDAQSDQVLNDALAGSPFVFNNFGTFRKSGGASELSSSTTFQSVIFNQLAGEIDVKNGTNGLELAFQGGGSFTGGFITTNSQGLTVFSVGNFNLNGTVTGTNTWEDAGNLVGNNVINGALNWVSGNWNGATSVTVPGNSLLIVAGGGGFMDMDGCTLTNNGIVAWASGTLRGGNTTVYNNGLWDAQSDQIFNNALGGSNPVFNNLGTFRKSGGASEFATATVFQNVVFNQLAGLIDVQNGTNGLELAFQGGGHFTGGYITTNKFGLTTLEANNYTINGTVTGTNTWETYNGNLVGNNVINGALNWVSGNWNSATSVTVPGNSLLIVAGGGGGFMDMDGCTLTNNGIVAWASGTLRGGNTTVYNNGLWDAQSDQIFNNALGGSNPVFNNLGTFRKSGGASEFATATVFQNVVFNQLAGLIDVQNGTNGLELAFQGGGHFTGGYITTNKFGLTTLEANNYTINGTVTGTNTWETYNGNLVGNNVINGALNWVSGNWNSATSVTVPGNSLLIVAGGGGFMDMDGCTLTNNGIVAWASGTLRGGNTTVYNNGLWDAQSDQIFNNALGGSNPVFNNLGTFRKSGTGGGSSQLQGVMFANSGTLDLKTGTLDLLGTYNLTGGTLSVTLNSKTNFGQLGLGGSAVLGGPLDVNLAGAFVPAVGDLFQIVSCSGVSGTFSTLTVPSGITVNYTNSGVFLDVTGLTPVQIIATHLAGGNLLFQFQTISGQGYTIQTNDDLTTTSWGYYTNVIGSGGVYQFQTPVAATPAQLFFRVQEP